MSDFQLRTKTWLNAREVKERVRKATISPLAKCALLVEGEAKKLLSRGATPVVGRDEFGKFVKTGQFKSGPAGEPPRMRTGNLRASIATAQTATGTFLVGPTKNAWYGRAHEFGAKIRVTKKMAGYLAWKFGWRVKVGTVITIPKRPFMRPALSNCVSKFPKAFAGIPLGGNVSAQDTNP